jgi:hypothetical protein
MHWPGAGAQEFGIFNVFDYREFLPGIFWPEREYFFVSTEHL